MSRRLLELFPFHPGPVEVVIPELNMGVSPGGGFRFRATAAGRSFHAVLRGFPGTMVYVRSENGVRCGKGWAACPDTYASAGHLSDLLSWAASGRVEAACRAVVTGRPA